MKKHIISLSALLLAATTLYAASARLDFFDKAGTFFSVIEDDLISLSYILTDEDNPDSGFSSIKIETTSGERTVDMDEYGKIVYSPATGLEPFAIEVETDGHCTVTMLDCLNNDGIIDPTKPNDWHGAESDYLGHFIYNPEYGYEMTVDIVGQYSGKIYTDTPGFVFPVSAADYAGWTDSWGFLMPNEPITILGTSTELTTYEGYSFVGQYTGYEIRKTPRVSTLTETTFNLDLRANGSYVVTTTDDNAFNFHYMYTYNEERNRTEHVVVQRPEWDNYTHYYGADCSFLDNGLVFSKITDHTTGKPEDVKLYLASSSQFTMTCAADPYGMQYLLRAESAGHSDSPDTFIDYTFIDNYGNLIYSATLDFRQGTDITGVCEAIISYDGDTHYKFVNDGNDNPEFIAKGLEAGSYTPQDDPEGAALLLDGFGIATIDGESHTYIIESGVVTLDGNGRVFNIDTTARTYQEVIQNDEWTGPTEFSIENAGGAYGNVETDKCSASIVLNSDLSGNGKPGYAALRIYLWDSSYGQAREVISSIPKYIYNKTNGTITLSGVLVGTGTGYSSKRANLVLNVASDLQSIWFDETANGPKIYSPTSPNDWFLTGTRNPLTAPQSTPVIAGTYTAGFPNLYMVFGAYPTTVNGSITIDKDASGNAKEGYAHFKINAMNTDIFNEVVEYEISGSTFILKDIEIGSGNYDWAADNLEFEITPEGNLQGSRKIFGNTTNTNGYGVDLSEAPFVPTTE